MGGLVMTDRFHCYRHPGPGQICGYLALHGRAGLLGGPLFCRLVLFLDGFSQNLFLLVSFLMVAFVVDYVEMSSQFQVQVMIGGLGFYILILVVFMPI